MLALFLMPIYLYAQQGGISINELENKINLERENNTQSAIRKAVLKWCIEDVKLSNEYNQTDLAKDRLDDAEIILKSGGIQRSALSAGDKEGILNDLLPFVDTVNNRIYSGFKNNVKKLLTDDRRFVKGDNGIVMNTTKDGWTFSKKANEALMLVQAFCHPQSPFENRPALIAPILRRFTAYCEYLKPSNPIFNDFGSNGTFLDAYFILKTVHPEAIPANCQKLWEARLMQNADSIYLKRSKDYLDNSKSHGLVNADVGYVLNLAIAYCIFHNPKYIDAVRGGLRYIQTSLLPDGATDYFDYQNEAFSYHAIAVTGIARIWQLTKLPEALDMIKKMKWYYPLSVEPGGVAEWGSAASWHHYWDATSGAEEAMIMSYLLNDPYNKTISTYSRLKVETLWLASFYNSKIPNISAPDKYFVFDQNIQGPRARYGQWSSFGNGRNYGLADKRGKSSYVGCMVLDNPSGFWPLNAAVQDVGMEVLGEPKTNYPDELKRKFKVISLSANENITTCVGSNCAALGSNCLLSVFTGDPKPWKERQAWLFTPERMIGIVSIEALQNLAAFGIQGDLLLLSRGLNSGTKKTLIKIDATHFKYGALNITIHAHDFENISDEETDVFTPSGKGAVRLMLTDNAQNGAVRKMYEKGTRHFYVVEIAPQTSAISSNVSFTNNEDMLSVQLSDGSGCYQIAYNAGNLAKPWTYINKNTSGTTLLHNSGEKYRPSWISSIPDNKNRPLIYQQGKSINIPAGEIILIQNSNK